MAGCLSVTHQIGYLPSSLLVLRPTTKTLGIVQGLPAFDRIAIGPQTILEFNRAVVSLEPGKNYPAPHWRRWLGIESPCVVPVTEVAEPDPGSNKDDQRTTNAWFALNDDQLLFFSAGIWTRWTSVRKLK